MGKGKLRHNPDKRANKKGGHCAAYDIIPGHPHPYCESGPINPKCGGNPHNCVKVYYQEQAIRRNYEQKTETLFQRGRHRKSQNG
jgi:hypothetical protein